MRWAEALAHLRLLAQRTSAMHCWTPRDTGRAAISLSLVPAAFVRCGANSSRAARQIVVRISAADEAAVHSMLVAAAGPAPATKKAKQVKRSARDGRPGADELSEPPSLSVGFLDTPKLCAHSTKAVLTSAADRGSPRRGSSNRFAIDDRFNAVDVGKPLANAWTRQVVHRCADNDLGQQQLATYMRIQSRTAPNSVIERGATITDRVQAVQARRQAAR